METQFMRLILAFVLFDFLICDPLIALTPYKNGHGPRRSNREVKSCQHVRYGNLTHELYNSNHDKVLGGIHKVEYISAKVSQYGPRITGHLIFINNPTRWLTIVEPGGPGGCEVNHRSTVRNTSSFSHCEAAINGGLFNTHTGQCYGNIVISGKVVQDSEGVQNAHFGITKAGDIFVGYLSEEEVLNSTFSLLLGGVVWLLRRGESYVRESAKVECAETEETGTMKRFVEVRSARSAVGHDADGRIVFAQVDGKTDQAGINLYEFAELLKSFKIVNAVNLDGGGSSTLVINQTVINYPSDTDPSNRRILRERPVTTILCVKSSTCARSQVGACAGLCLNNGTCDFPSGRCHCPPGFHGRLCEKQCSSGYWGFECRHICTCEHTCGQCDPVTGVCNHTRPCCEKNLPTAHNSSQERTWFIMVISLTIVVAISLVLNISLVCTLCRDDRPKYSRLNNSGSPHRAKFNRHNPRDFEMTDILQDEDD